MNVCTSCTVCHCRQHVWILALLLSLGLHLQCKTCELKRKDPQNLNILSESRRVQPQLGPEKKTSALAVIIARFWALKILVHKISRLPVLCHCCCFAPCSCCHDPFIVRNVKLVRHSRFHSARTFVLIRDREHRLFLHRFHQIQNSGRHPPSRSGVWDPWSVEYQSCKLAMLL